MKNFDNNGLPELVGKMYSKEISYLLFNVTARCNAFCDHCWNWERVEDAGKFNKGQSSRRLELDLNEIQNISLNFPDLILVNLCGGEPFIREDLPDIARIFALQNNTNYFTIPSNGFDTDTILKKAERMLKENPDSFFRFGISLDGFPKLHNKLRRFPEGFQSAIETARGLLLLKKKYSNFSIGSDVLFSTDTQGQIKEFIRYLHSLTIFDQIDMNMVRGELMDNRIKEINLELYQETIDEILRMRSSNNSHHLTPVQTALFKMTTKTITKARTSNKREFTCYAGQKFITLDDCGDVHACEILEGDNFKLGNLRDYEYDIHLLLQNPKAQEIIQYIMDKRCHCTWDCAINMSWIYDPRNLPLVAWNSLKSLI